MQKFWDNPCGADTAAPEDARQAAPRAFPKSFSIGNVPIAPATVLAPMSGVTDAVFRRFIKNLGGCGLIMTEFTSADGVLRDQRVRGRYLHFYEDEHPISAQLFGSSPSVLADAARLVEDLGFDLVDLNLGCPAKKVVKCNGGSGLLRDLPLIRQIFEAVRAAVKIPFTVKFRAGWNDDEIVCVELARMAESCGLGAVALHARTREQGYSGNARWEWIASVKQAVKIPVIGNGDIRSPEDACAIVAQTGCDAVMIGRMAPANPWIFRQIEQYRAWMESARENTERFREGYDFSRAEHGPPSAAALAAEGASPSGAKALHFLPAEGTTEVVPFPSVTMPRVSPSGKPYDEPTEADRYQMIRTYFQMLLEEEMPGAEGKMKQFASWFTHGIPGGAALRKAIYEAKTGAQILARVEEFFEAKLPAQTR
ncbi:MAG: tRNA dihydrouridine synthase DusB [Terriglobales bacterium]